MICHRATSQEVIAGKSHRHDGALMFSHPYCPKRAAAALMADLPKRDRFRDVAPDAIHALTKAVAALVDAANALARGDLDDGSVNAASALLHGAGLLNVASDLRQLRDRFE